MTEVLENLKKAVIEYDDEAAARWNNILSIVLGIVALCFFIAVLVTGVGLTSFIGLVVIGGVT